MSTTGMIMGMIGLLAHAGITGWLGWELCKAADPEVSIAVLWYLCVAIWWFCLPVLTCVVLLGLPIPFKV